MTSKYRFGLMLFAGAAIGAAAVTGLQAQVKPPVYVVVDISEMSDAAAFAKVAGAVSPQQVASVGGKYIIRSTNPTALDGSAPPARFAVIAFEDEAHLNAWRDLASTKEVNEIRLKVTKSRSFEVEGVTN